MSQSQVIVLLLASIIHKNACSMDGQTLYRVMTLEPQMSKAKLIENSKLEKRQVQGEPQEVTLNGNQPIHVSQSQTYQQSYPHQVSIAPLNKDGEQLVYFHVMPEQKQPPNNYYLEYKTNQPYMQYSANQQYDAKNEQVYNLNQNYEQGQLPPYNFNQYPVSPPQNDPKNGQLLPHFVFAPQHFQNQNQQDESKGQMQYMPQFVINPQQYYGQPVQEEPKKEFVLEYQSPHYDHYYNQNSQQAYYSQNDNKIESQVNEDSKNKASQQKYEQLLMQQGQTIAKFTQPEPVNYVPLQFLINNLVEPVKHEDSPKLNRPTMPIYHYAPVPKGIFADTKDLPDMRIKSTPQQTEAPLENQQAPEESKDYDDGSNYDFGYRVTDNEHGVEMGKTETKDNGVTKGSYHVLLPDGRLQVVKYWSDHTGYHTKITYTNSNDNTS